MKNQFGFTKIHLPLCSSVFSDGSPRQKHVYVVLNIDERKNNVKYWDLKKLKIMSINIVFTYND